MCLATLNLYYQRPNRNPSVLTLKNPQRIQTAVASESCEDICFRLFHSGGTGGRTGQCMITGAGKHTLHGATAATPRREIWLATLYNLTSIFCAVYPAEWRLTRKETAHTHALTQKKKKLSLTFSLFHGNSRHCIPEVHVGCSSNKGSVLESPQLKTLSTLFSALSFS